MGSGLPDIMYLADLKWLDSFLNASMILTGMGPVDKMETDGGKIIFSTLRNF